jgi:hypothetical protein
VSWARGVIRVISGGQTGADRGGIDAAVDLGIATGGHAPRGWRAEDGVIPVELRAGMMTTESPHYFVRTRLNVEVADGTMVISFSSPLPPGGSRDTIALARRVGKPYHHVTLLQSGRLTNFVLERARAWLAEHGVRVLNVAGPRESREPGIRAATRQAIVRILTE